MRARRDGKEIKPEHRGCVCCERPLEQAVPNECKCGNHPKEVSSK